MSDGPTPKEAPFFIGFVAPPRGLRGFLLGISAALLVGFAAGGLLASVVHTPPDQAGFRFDWGRQTVTGVLAAKPYPHVHITEGSENLPAGRTILLSGQGKRGAQRRADALDGQVVVASGVAVVRGEMQTLQLRGGANGLAAADDVDPAPPPETVSLGRWRLSGEICDGKCLTGAMRPGVGLSHKACANLCLQGGVAPVFVSAGEVEGESFFLLGAADGGPLPDAMLTHVAQPVALTGEVSRRGSILVFLVDTDAVEVLR